MEIILKECKSGNVITMEVMNNEDELHKYYNKMYTPNLHMRKILAYNIYIYIFKICFNKHLKIIEKKKN